jgi:hypothetical protein
LPTTGACGASSCATPTAIRRVGLGIDASPSVPESATRRQHDHNGSRNARPFHNHFVIRALSADERRRRNTSRSGSVSSSATRPQQKRRTHPLQAHTAPSNYPPARR